MDFFSIFNNSIFVHIYSTAFMYNCTYSMYIYFITNSWSPGFFLALFFCMLLSPFFLVTLFLVLYFFLSLLFFVSHFLCVSFCRFSFCQSLSLYLFLLSFLSVAFSVFLSCSIFFSVYSFLCFSC